MDLNTFLPNVTGTMPMSGTIAPTTSLAKSKPKWPFPFDTNGGAYVFQAQSGYFLEPISQFFYCPKSKLYYSCLEGTYYQYIPGALNGVDGTPFVRYIPPLPMESEHNVGTSASSTTESHSLAESSLRKPVILSMGLSSVKGIKSMSKTPSIVNKKVEGELKKWAARLEEDEEEEAKPPVAILTAPKTSSSSGRAITPPNPILTLR